MVFKFFGIFNVSKSTFYVPATSMKTLIIDILPEAASEPPTPPILAASQLVCEPQFCL
jgi:hypothetical protein